MSCTTVQYVLQCVIFFCVFPHIYASYALRFTIPSYYYTSWCLYVVYSTVGYEGVLQRIPGIEMFRSTALRSRAYLGGFLVNMHTTMYLSVHLCPVLCELGHMPQGQWGGRSAGSHRPSSWIWDMLAGLLLLALTLGYLCGLEEGSGANIVAHPIRGWCFVLHVAPSSRSEAGLERVPVNHDLNTLFVVVADCEHVACFSRANHFNTTQ